MGTWGSKTFENDAALDWAWTVPKKGWAHIEATLDNVLAEEQPEAPLSEEALAAVACVLAALGESRELPAEISTWLKSQKGPPDSSIVSKAKAALSKILEHSELKLLWEEADDLASWHAEVLPMKERLARVPTSKPSKAWWKIW